MTNREIVDETFHHFGPIKFSTDKNVPLANMHSKLTLELLGKLHGCFSSVFLVDCAQIFICDALREFGSNANKRRSNAWSKRRSLTS